MEPITGNKKCDKELNTLITKFVKGFRLLQKKYSNEGLGDTSVDTELTTEIYERIHYED